MNETLTPYRTHGPKYRSPSHRQEFPPPPLLPLVQHRLFGSWRVDQDTGTVSPDLSGLSVDVLLPRRT